MAEKQRLILGLIVALSLSICYPATALAEKMTVVPPAQTEEFSLSIDLKDWVSIDEVEACAARLMGVAGRDKVRLVALHYTAGEGSAARWSVAGLSPTTANLLRTSCTKDVDDASSGSTVISAGISPVPGGRGFE